LLVAPDYIGLGISAAAHPYLHAVTEANAVIDLLRAARVIVDAKGYVWPSRVMLVGFSQGGHSTLAAQRALEATPIDGIEVAASASIARPSTLRRSRFRTRSTARSRAPYRSNNRRLQRTVRRRLSTIAGITMHET
jgi:dienelactone hydrolase